MVILRKTLDQLAELTTSGNSYTIPDLMDLVGRRQRVAALRSFITQQGPRILEVDEVFQFEANQQVTRMQVVEELRKA